jgi:hypothetical protein
MRWAGHGARMGEVLAGKPEGKDLLEDRGVHGRMRSEWILEDALGGC